MSTILKNWRIGAHLSSDEAAKKVGVSLPTWSRWETGARRVPAERVQAVSQFTGIPPHVLRPEIFGLDSEGTAA